MAVDANAKKKRFNYLVRLLKQQYELHAHGGQASAVGAVQAAVAQEHPQQWLVALQPVSPAPLAVARTSRLESDFFLKCVSNERKGDSSPAPKWEPFVAKCSNLKATVRGLK